MLGESFNGLNNLPLTYWVENWELFEKSIRDSLSC